MSRGEISSSNIDLQKAGPDRLPILAALLVVLQPNVILAIGGDVAPIAKKFDEAIPLVFVSSADPEQLGLVASLRRPGGNATGVTLFQDALASKRLELLKEAAPQISRVAFLWNPDHPDNEQREAQRVAQALGVQLHLVEVRGSGDFETAFRAANSAGIDSMYVVSSRQPVLNIQKGRSVCDEESASLGRRLGLGQKKVGFFRMALTESPWPVAPLTTSTRFLRVPNPLICRSNSRLSLN
jgi:ABC-type uncharacterized transport system substrate-binding protein